LFKSEDHQLHIFGKKKKTRIKGPDIPVISQTHGMGRFHERTPGFLGSYLTFVVFLRTTVIYQNQVL
jgi:hypothetical protein